MAGNGLVYDSYYAVGICGRDYRKYCSGMGDMELFENALSGIGTDMCTIYAPVVYDQFSCNSSKSGMRQYSAKIVYSVSTCHKKHMTKYGIFCCIMLLCS